MDGIQWCWRHKLFSGLVIMVERYGNRWTVTSGILYIGFMVFMAAGAIAINAAGFSPGAIAFEICCICNYLVGFGWGDMLRTPVAYRRHSHRQLIHSPYYSLARI